MPRYSTRQQVRQAALVLRQHPHQLQEVTTYSSLNMVKRTFPFAVVGEWNALPAEIFDGRPQMDNLQGFKVAVHQHLRSAQSRESARYMANILLWVHSVLVDLVCV